MFRLLGIQFCNTLNDMHSNYQKGIQNMLDIANNLKFRYLTLFRKITVIKIFMLPQLQPIATVVLNLAVKQIEEIHRIGEDFIRCGSHTVVDVKTLYTPVKEGGLGLHKGADFWGAIKLLWLR